MNFQAGQAGIQTPVTGEQVTAGLKQQQDFINALNAQHGLQNQTDVYNQFQNVANGAGPNPAQAMLAQATGQNVANQAALMAGQRGASANVGLMARQAANQGANLQQQAVGQGATMQAQQALGALGQMGGIAGQQVANQAGTIQNYNNNLLGGIGAQNQAQVGSMASQNAANASVASTIAKGQLDAIGGLMGGGGGAGAAAAAAGAKGGEVPNDLTPISNDGPQSTVGMFLSNTQMAQGGKVPALVSPGEGYLSPTKVQDVAQGRATALSSAEKIPGKPKVGGAVDSYQNDTVRKDLDEGGVILPRSVMESENPQKKAAEFVAAVLAKSGKSIGSAMPKKKK